MSLFGLIAQGSEGDGPRLPWGWIWGIITGLLTACVIAGFKLVWRGAMADFERRLDKLENELAYSERRHHEAERADRRHRGSRMALDDAGDG